MWRVGRSLVRNRRYSAPFMHEAGGRGVHKLAKGRGQMEIREEKFGETIKLGGA